MQPTCVVGDASLYHADCRDVLRSLADNSIDSVVSDPPYALVSIVKRFGKPGSAPAKGDVYARAGVGFMNKSWDTGEVAFSEEFWAEVLRVLKPGGHVVAFSGTRTYHRMAVAIEDAGFEIRDQLGWLYGSGFPKSHNQHDEWEGWGTALKPAWEPIALARKPLDGTVAANLAKWGVGAINVDGCRVGDEIVGWGGGAAGGNTWNDGNMGLGKAGEARPVAGRWPANIVHDGSDEVLTAFPETKSGGGPAVGTPRSKVNTYGEPTVSMTPPKGANEGSAARFFYCAKASRKDRDEGLEGVEGRADAAHRRTNIEETADNPYLRGVTVRKNTHPTVKPTDLMRWLCRLVTPPGGTILEPFMGSGSTGKAALLEGFRFIGCEREDEYMSIAEARIAAALRPAVAKQPPAAIATAPKPANDNRQADLFGAAA